MRIICYARIGKAMNKAQKEQIGVVMGTRNEVKMHSVRKLAQDADFFMINEMCGNRENEVMSVDVIIPTYRPDHKFDQLMKRLRKQTVQPNKIIILNTVPASCDSEEARHEQDEFMQKYRELNHATIVHIPQNEFDHGATRDYGASLSNADLVMFMTQDAIPADEYLIEEIIKPFQNPMVGAAYGRQMAMTNADEIEAFTRVFNYPPESRIKTKADLKTMGIKTFFCSDVCAVYRKSLYEKLGGFVKKTIFNEDMIFASKLIQNNYGVAYVAEAKVFHSHHYSYRQQFKRNFDLGVSHAEYKEVFQQVSSTSEGKLLVKKTFQHLAKRHSYLKMVDLFFMSGFKYMGFFFGKRYQRLPKKLVLKWTGTPNYWK